MRFRKLPVEIDAVLWTGENLNEIQEFMSPKSVPYNDYRNDSLWIATLEGGHIASVGDWIIRGVAGEYYPCKPDIFEKTYERVL